MHKKVCKIKILKKINKNKSDSITKNNKLIKSN